MALDGLYAAMYRQQAGAFGVAHDGIDMTNAWRVGS
jgi:hypothetical protein